MSFSLGDYPVFASGKSVGTVTVSSSGLMTVFDCACRLRSREIMRLAAVCGGKFVTLGVLAPVSGAPSDGGELRMKKSFSKNALHELGFDEVGSFQLIRAGEVYAGEADAPSFSAEAAPPSSIDDAWSYVAPDLSEARDSSLVTGTGLAPDHANDEPALLADNGTPAETAPSESRPPEPEQPETAPAPAENTGLTFDLSEFEKILSKMNLFSPTPGPVSETAPAPAPQQAENILAADGWTRVKDPASFFSDLAESEAEVSLTGALTTTRDGYELLAVPVSPEEPFPLMSVFCFGSPGVIDGREYIIFKLVDGNLTL